MNHNKYKVKNGSSKEFLKTFTPRAKLEPLHSLVSNHMKAHYKRIASAQAKTDSHPPTSMLKSIKVKERQATPTKYRSNDSLKYDKCQDKCTCEPFDDLDCKNKPADTNKNRLDSIEEDLTDNHPERWRLYATKTGQLTGYLNKSRNFNFSKQSDRKEVWKPAFSLNTTSTINTYYPSLSQSATCDVISHGVDKKMRVGVTDVSITPDVVKGKGYSDSFGELATSLTSNVSVHSPSKKYVTNTEVNEDKMKMLQRQEELEYLGFISGITQDILSRRFLSDAALELLIGCHVERNLHKLNKDKMMERVAKLKEQLGFTT